MAEPTSTSTFKELRPHADEWEAAEYFPDSVFLRMGELGLLGLRYPEE